MANDSSTGGVLVPQAPGVQPSTGDAFVDLIGDFIAGICEIDRDLVRPRWQPKPPAMPDITVDWCAFGITESVSDWSAQTRHDPSLNAGQGGDIVSQHETIRAIASFYGPAGYSKAVQLRLGLWVPQNWESLRQAEVLLREGTTIRTTSALMNERWVPRCDLELSFRRKVTAVYPVLNILTAQGVIKTMGGYAQNFTAPIPIP